MIRVGCGKLSALQGGIRQIIGPAGWDTTNYRPCRAGYGKLSALRGGIRQIISPAGLYIILKPWASSGKYQNQNRCLFSSSKCHCKAHRISALPCNNVNMPPLPSGTGKYAAHGPHYASHGPHYLPTGHIMLPSVCIMLPSGLRPSGSIMQPSGSIMCP